MRKYDFSSIRDLEPSFLPLAGNGRSYVCPVCGSGTGKHGSGLTSRDGEYWRCWSCGKSYSKVDLYGIQNRLPFEAAAEGLFRFYGMEPQFAGDGGGARPAVWLSRDELDALALCDCPARSADGGGQRRGYGLSDLLAEDPEAYYSMVIDRADEMMARYAAIMRDYGDRSAPRASLVYDWLGDKFSDSSYRRVRQELERRTDVCRKVRSIYGRKLQEVLSEASRSSSGPRSAGPEHRRSWGRTAPSPGSGRP